MSGEFAFVYTTLPNAVAAQGLAEALVRARLAACCNIYPPMISVFEWDGTMGAEPEVAMTIKTRVALVPELIAFARAKHPYKLPCFLTLPIEGGNEDYLAWARAQTKGAR